MEKIASFRLGPYEINATLRQGTTEVYYGYDQNFGNEVVVKFLPAGVLSDPEFSAHFKDEIRVISLASLPSVVPIYDLGEDQGRVFLVSRYMPGGSLADLLREGPLSLAEAVSVTCQLAIALDAAHACGVLHRNIKPENILFDGDGTAYLSDFGLVRRDAQAGVRSVNPIDGAPAYASPEQALGRPDVDGRSDIYSLGSVLYEMFTGQPPFPSHSPVDQAVKNVLEPHVDILKLKPDLPKPCSAVINRAMSKNPNARYPSGYAFVQDLIKASGLSITLPAPEGSTLEAAQNNPQPRSGRRIWVPALLLLAILVFSLGIITQGRVWESAKAQFNAVAGLILPSPSRSPTLETPLDTSTPSITSLPTQPPTSQAVLELPAPLESTSTAILKEVNTPAPENSPLVIGMADKIAYISNQGIRMANLDGSQSVLLLKTSAAVLDLRWTPDGKGLIYLLDKCHYLLPVVENQASTPIKLGCFEDFEISPDMIRMVIGGVTEMTNKTFRWRNFIGPFDLSILQKLNTIPLTETMGGCPYAGGRLTRFSPDLVTMAAVFQAPMGGRNMDTIQVYRMTECGEKLDVIDSFPGTRFEMKWYSGPNESSTLSDFGWDGNQLFALHGNGLNGYGQIVIYNMAKHEEKVYTPIELKQCCYQDIQFSPDGYYVLFVYQDARTGKDARIYYVPYNTLGTDIDYVPLNLPDLASNPKTRLEPALREYRP